MTCPSMRPGATMRLTPEHALILMRNDHPSPGEAPYCVVWGGATEYGGVTDIHVGPDRTAVLLTEQCARTLGAPQRSASTTASRRSTRTGSERQWSRSWPNRHDARMNLSALVRNLPLDGPPVDPVNVPDSV